MIIVKLQGGLGNQMFQYATARAILKNKHPVYLDHSFLDFNNIDNEHFTARKYELSVFKNIHARKAKSWQVALLKNQSVGFKIIRCLLKPTIKYIQEVNHECISFLYLNEYKYLYLDGYFQSEKYFKSCRKAILKDFKFPSLDTANDVLKKKIENTSNSVSIHIRRRDYLKPANINIHGVLSLHYYTKALATFKKKYTAFTLFVFSDDIDWAIVNIKPVGFDINFITHNNGADSWKDMALMSYCKHHIIANSSFSWWGAWLSDKPGTTLAPKNWFNDHQLNLQAQSIIPNTWITI